MKERDGFWPVLAVLILMAALALYIAMQGQAKAETKGEWFRSLKVPGTTNSSCCDEADCLPTKAEHNGTQWFAEVKGTMQPVPNERIVRNPVSYDGRAYVCVWGGVILCFIPPGAGS